MVMVSCFGVVFAMCSTYMSNNYNNLFDYDLQLFIKFMMPVKLKLKYLRLRDLKYFLMDDCH